MKAQLAVLEALVCGDDRRIEIAEKRVAQCVQRLVKAALVPDRILTVRSDDDGRRRLVDGALRLAAATTATA